MKCSAFSFKNPASPHDRLSGIILPEGSDKFDKFQRRQGSGALPLRGFVSLRESAYPATIRDAGRVMAPRKAAKTRRVLGPALRRGHALSRHPCRNAQIRLGARTPLFGKRNRQCPITIDAQSRQPQHQHFAKAFLSLDPSGIAFDNIGHHSLANPHPEKDPAL